MGVNILGIAGQGHDAAAALVCDGRLVAAAEEERFMRIKHVGIDRAGGLPMRAIEYCLRAAGITADQITHVAYYQNIGAKFGRFLGFRLKRAWRDPAASAYYSCGLLADLRSMLKTRELIRRRFVRARYYEVAHHMAHAASAFLVSPFDSAALMVIDASGELTATSLGVGLGKRMEIFREFGFPHSLGMVYGSVTHYLGFDPNSDEYKVMGLAAYGRPRYENEFADFLRLETDGGYSVNLSYFNLGFRGPDYLSEKFYRVFGPRRAPNDPIEDRHADIAASLQKRLEDVVWHLAKYLAERTGEENLCFAGGVALNCSMNGQLYERTPFRRVFIQPAAGDAGTAVGGAFYVYHQILGHERSWVMRDAYLGPEFGDDDIEKVLRIAKLRYARLERSYLLQRTAALLAEGKIIGWFQGRMEWGPRALGNRSILADPTRPDMRDLINTYVKHREEFRPFAPSVVEERAVDFFEIDGPSPFMLFACRVREAARSRIPSVVHVNGTARVQTVSRATNPLYYDLHLEFEKHSGVPILLNTSFNVMGEPIVCTPRDAIRCYAACGLDALVIGPYLVLKE
jgi:carbamoyltransferase